jgi:hypothetical protein
VPVVVPDDGKARSVGWRFRRTKEQLACANWRRRFVLELPVRVRRLDKRRSQKSASSYDMLSE